MSIDKERDWYALHTTFYSARTTFRLLNSDPRPLRPCQRTTTIYVLSTVRPSQNSLGKTAGTGDMRSAASLFVLMQQRT